jgi:hypothetical protein
MMSAVILGHAVAPATDVLVAEIVDLDLMLLSDDPPPASGA